MLTSPKIPKTASQASFWFSLCLTLASPAVWGQEADAYRVAINMGRGTPPLIGFLYAVNDTSIVLLPHPRLRKKDVQPTLENVKPVSIPLRIIKSIRVAKVRTAGYVIGVGSLFTLGYAIAYIAIFPIETFAGFVVYTAVVTTATIYTMAFTHSKKFRPEKPGFVMLMQKYCLKRAGLALDR